MITPSISSVKRWIMKIELKIWGILVNSDLNWNTHINKRIDKANSVHNLLRRNFAYNVSNGIKTYLYKPLSASSANSPLWHSMHIIVKVGSLHLGKVSKQSSEMDLWNWLIHSTDQNAEHAPTTDVYTVAKFLATITALKRTTKQHQATTNTGYVITMERLIKLPKTRTEKMRRDIVFRTSRLANKVNHLIDFSWSTGLRKWIIQNLSNFVETKFN